jgi:serine/arginine repetitive matrix protein 2
MAALQGNPNNLFLEFMLILQVSENWDDDFEFQVEKRKMSTATAKSEATENWDDDFEDSRQSPKKIIQRQREETWDDEEDDDDYDENSEFGLFAEEDHTVTAKSRRAALARLSAPVHLPQSPTSSVFSVPTTIHTYSSTAHLRPTSAFALISPSPPIQRERERRRLRKKSRPKPQAVIELVEIPSQERPSLSDVDLRRPASELDSRRSSTSDLSIHQRPPLVASAVADTSIGSSNGPVSIPQTPTKGAALLSRIGSVKKWGVRRKRGDSTAPTDANGMYDRRTRLYFFD